MEDSSVQVNLNIQQLSEWRISYDAKLLIAGPCSIESEEQIMQTALALKQQSVNVLRGGIWKPRTRPGQFQGVGIQGITWLKNAGRAIGVPVAAEVASPDHVEHCLKGGIDILWIGARTSVNPFSVQAIADALKGVDIPVMVKNPINPDIDLWIGALERFNQSGITKLAAVHRGFSSYRKTEYRNVPNWALPLELKRRVPALPLLCDPSHICGETGMIAAVAQESMDLLYDGLMIEVHINPSAALSDSQQQLTPENYGTLIKNLTIKKPSTQDQELYRQIMSFRKEIDDIDAHIIDSLGKRMVISRQLGAIKKRDTVAAYQPDRWSEIIQSRTKAGIRLNLAAEFIEQIYQLIHEESVRHQGLAQNHP
ncbi:MAG: bifunctional 3-deoxy-7-phosphoheptulonate synthase/chorismate mutase type II [Desulfosalsimonadaceae bacterium]|nr:bifunctional 3-deoxy-7-phosphoheptulonate synthase/chorismate mutase type II [Desulfosalsimonadaceae bacterium]